MKVSYFLCIAFMAMFLFSCKIAKQQTPTITIGNIKISRNSPSLLSDTTKKEYFVEGYFIKDPQPIIVTDLKWTRINTPMPDSVFIVIGGSYKVGWGRNWNSLEVTNQGIGLRSFIDWKFHGNLWLSGGYEMNYKTAFKNISQLRSLSAWQRSGLIGITKTIPIKSKFLKKTKFQVLWDFISYTQQPKTTPVIFRVGYCF